MIGHTDSLADWFHNHPRVAVALSGGCDSALVLHSAVRSGAQVLACMVQSQFQPAFEREDAMRLARDMGVQLAVIPCDILALPVVVNNPVDRCYHCKKAIFQAIVNHAGANGFACVVDGSNASDNPDERPGMRALEELGVQSPLRACGLTKQDVRALSREAGLFTWNKAANACLATRIPPGHSITAAMLERIEQAEDSLRQLGFDDVRVRWFHEAARVQLPEAQFARAVAMRPQICAALQRHFDTVLLDLVPRQTTCPLP